MRDLGKVLVWLFLLAVVATAGSNGVKLTRAIWQAWQLDSSESAETGSPEIAASRIVYNH